VIAISSHRPLADSLEYARTQLLARASWEDVFEHIVYFGQPQAALDGPNTTFIESEEFPRIAELMALAAEQRGWCCLINADIVVAPHLAAIEKELMRQRARAAISKRWQFEMDDETVPPRVVDLGLDFFAASPAVWREGLAVVPPDFRIGHCRWDSWMLGYFNFCCGSGCRDLTRAQVIFHPRHGGRKTVYDIPASAGDDYSNYIRFPAPHRGYAATF
jgi:hypothetical protein